MTAWQPCELRQLWLEVPLRANNQAVLDHVVDLVQQNLQREGDVAHRSALVRFKRLQFGNERIVVLDNGVLVSNLV